MTYSYKVFTERLFVSWPNICLWHPKFTVCWLPNIPFLPFTWVCFIDLPWCICTIFILEVDAVIFWLVTLHGHTSGRRWWRSLLTDVSITQNSTHDLLQRHLSIISWLFLLALIHLYLHFGSWCGIKYNYKIFMEGIISYFDLDI